MATPPGYILIKRSELVPQTPRPVAETKELKVEVPDENQKQQLESSKPLASRRSRLAKPSRGRQSSGLPPEINATITKRMIYRYIAQDASATAKTVTSDTMLLSFGGMAITTTTLQSMISSFKLHRVTVYPGSESASVTPSCNLYWYEGSSVYNVKDESKTRPFPKGMTKPGAVVYVPPKDSEVSWWQSGQSARSMFELSASVGSVVDVDVTITILNVGTNIFSSSFSGLTAGITYYPALDGRATNDFAPVGRSNAT